MALPDALKDADKAIEVQPDFGAPCVPSFPVSACTDLLASTVKGYIRKSHVLFAMKEYGKAMTAIEQVTLLPPSLPLRSRSRSSTQAAEKDTAQKHTSEIAAQLRKVSIADSESRAGETDAQAYERAMRDPEIQQIMGDPVFQGILQQAQNEPASLQQHMQNPSIRAKIEKLARAVRFLPSSVSYVALGPGADSRCSTFVGHHQDALGGDGW